MIIHVVKSGETLYQISNYYNVPIENTIAVNQLPDPNNLLIGQSIIIPIKGYTHIVRSGETLWEIAKEHGITMQSLIKANNITNATFIYPGNTLIIPIDRPKTDISVNGYIYKFDEEAVSIVNEDGEYLTYLSPFAYRIRADGTLYSIEDTEIIKASYSKKVVPMMSITNFTSTELGANVAHIILSSPLIIEKLITNIIKTLKEKNYKGVNIDFENVLPSDRELYNNFLKLLVERLHRQGFFASSALAPKTSGEQKGSLYEAHDYEAHGEIMDFVILMTYEWGYRLGPPQAISPLNEIISVLNYAITVIPREKIYFGFQLYARDWLLPHVKGQQAETFSMQEAIKKAVKYNARINYDVISQSPFYNYKDEKGIMHQVWFEDARSAQAKFDTVKSYKLSGISYWALGFPFPQNWVLLQDNFNVKKLL